MINTRSRGGLESTDTALRLLLESRQDRVRASRVRTPVLSRTHDGDDWQTVALEQMADSVLFIARKNQVLQDEVHSLRDELRRLRARMQAA